MNELTNSYHEKLKRSLVEDLAAYLPNEIEAMLGQYAADRLNEYRDEIASEENVKEGETE